MKITKTTATVVALALALSSSAFAAPTGKGKGVESRESRATAPGAKSSAQKAKELPAAKKLIGDISNGTRIQRLDLGTVKIDGEQIKDLNNVAAEAYVEGLFGAQQGRLFSEIQANPSKPEFAAIWANVQIKAAKKLLTTENLEWVEVIEGKEHKVNSMDFINGEALGIAKGSSPKFLKFMNRITELESNGSSTRDAFRQALKEAGISLKEFVEKCLLK